MGGLRTYGQSSFTGMTRNRHDVRSDKKPRTMPGLYLRNVFQLTKVVVPAQSAALALAWQLHRKRRRLGHRNGSKVPRWG
jgi:hypothetical protein